MANLTDILHNQPRRVDLSDQLTPEFFADKKHKVGTVLGFNQDGVLHRYRIVRLNRKSKKCEAVEVSLYHESEVKGLELPDDL